MVVGLSRQPTILTFYDGSLDLEPQPSPAAEASASLLLLFPTGLGNNLTRQRFSRHRFLGLEVHDPAAEHERHVQLALAALGDGA